MEFCGENYKIIFMRIMNMKSSTISLPHILFIPFLVKPVQFFEKRF
jgi:hypothetical protein